MANITPPYADIGAAKFQVLDTYLMSHLLAGSEPELAIPYSFPLANSTSFLQFSVVGLDANGKLTLATNGQAAAAATGTLTFSGVGTATETVTIGSQTYTLVATLTGVANQILIGASATATAANLAAAINGSAGAGTTYGTGTAAHPAVTASPAAGVITLTAKYTGSVANQVATTETSAVAAFGATTLTGGRDRAGVQAIGIVASAVSLGASGTANASVFYQGCFNQDALVWDASFSTDADKQAAFRGAPTPTNIIITKR